jgi:hypothetical protein
MAFRREAWDHLARSSIRAADAARSRRSCRRNRFSYRAGLHGAPAMGAASFGVAAVAADKLPGTDDSHLRERLSRSPNVTVPASMDPARPRSGPSPGRQATWARQPAIRAKSPGPRPRSARGHSHRSPERFSRQGNLTGGEYGVRPSL